MNEKKKYPIRAVVQLTGLSAFTIRAWERRYKTVEPLRTETNRRMYTEEDIEKLKLLNGATRNGHNIGSIAALSVGELRELITVRNFNSTRSTDNGKIELPDSADGYTELCLNAIKKLDQRGLENILSKASVNLSQPQLLENLLLPLLDKIGSCWQDGSIRVVNEHMASSVIRTFLANQKDSFRAEENAPRLIIATPTGQLHEFGALIASAIAAFEGWNAVYLGPNLPAIDIISAAEQLNARGVVLSISYEIDDQYLRRDLEKLEMITGNIPLIVGGRGVKLYGKSLENTGARFIDDWKLFRSALTQLVKQPVL